MDQTINMINTVAGQLLLANQYEQLKVQQRAANRRYYERHRVERANYHKQWYEANKERLQQHYRQKQQERREALRNQQNNIPTE